jgi:putative serine protease PepD
VGTDVSTDLAVLKIDPSRTKVKPLPLGSSSGVQVGDPVVAIGSPLGYEDTVTSGIVSNLQRRIDSPNQFTISHAIQTDAAINPGNSGGPLIDAGGRVIGINSQIATAGDGSRGFVGIGFAIPIDLAKKVFPQLIEHGHVPHAYIGVTTSPVPSAGALVQEVAPGSPADRAGIAPGDVIVGVDGDTVKQPDDISRAIADNKPGDRAEIELAHDRTVTVTLADRPDDVVGDQPAAP